MSHSVVSTIQEPGAFAPAARTGDPRAYARIFWRWKFLLLAFLVVIPIATYFYERGRPKTYESSSLLEITGGQQLGVASLLNQAPSGPDTTDLLADARLITTTGIAKLAAGYLHPSPAPQALVGLVTANADTNTGFITINAKASSPRRAADIANAFAQAVVANQSQAATAQVNTAISQLQAQISQLRRNDPGRAQLAIELARFRALRAAQSAYATVVEAAAPSSAPIAPRVTRSVILALIVALLLGLGAVALAEQSDRRVRQADDVADAAGLPLLGAVPVEAFTASTSSSGKVIESFVTLRSSLTYFNVDRRLSSVLITSPGKEDGKTTVSVQLARALARAGKEVIVVDADLRRPAVAERLGIPPRQGLGAVLIGELSVDEALLVQRGSNGRRGSLRVLPAGPSPPNPSELLGSRRMHEVLSELAERCDLVLIDSTPLLTVSDSMPLLPAVSGVVLVARLNRTSREAMARLKFVVDSAGGHAFGVVVTGTTDGGLYVAPGYGYEAAYAASGVDTNGGGGSGRLRRLRRGSRKVAEPTGAGQSSKD